MFSRKLLYSTLFFLLLLAIILAAIISHGRKNDLQVAFLNVGQGDAILISEGSNQVLIDGGKDGKLLLQKLGKFMPFWDRNIETIIETHPDADHIGGFVDLFKAYNVENILKTNSESESATFKKLEEEIQNESGEKIEAKKDIKIVFPNGASLNILYPLYSVSKDEDSSNENSVVAKLVYGENTFLFTGDLPIAKESEIMNSAANLKSSVLKVAHHGSKYSTSEEFLEAVKPREAVIPVGKNSYGHPNEEALDRLSVRKINILRTDEIGDIIYECKNVNSACIRNL